MGHSEHTWVPQTAGIRTVMSGHSDVEQVVGLKSSSKMICASQSRLIWRRICFVGRLSFPPPVRTPTWLKRYHSVTVSCIFCLLHTERKSFSAVGSSAGLLLHLVFHLGSLWTCSHVPGPLVSPQMAWNSHLMQYYSARPAAGSNSRPARSQHVTRRAGRRVGETRRQPKDQFQCF